MAHAAKQNRDPHTGIAAETGQNCPLHRGWHKDLHHQVEVHLVA
jgi:hypothetical protein